MTTTINASTSSGLVVTPDNSGNVLLQYNGVAAPAFSAYNGGTFTATAASNTLALFPTEDFDTNNNFASNRFTPTVAGYYQLSTALFFGSGGSGAQVIVWISKNNSTNQEVGRSTSYSCTLGGSVLFYANGTTDYFEVYIYSTNTQTVGASGQQYIWFTGCLLRGA